MAALQTPQVIVSPARWVMLSTRGFAFLCASSPYNQSHICQHPFNPRFTFFGYSVSNRAESNENDGQTTIESRSRTRRYRCLSAESVDSCHRLFKRKGSRHDTNATNAVNGMTGESRVANVDAAFRVGKGEQARGR